MLLACYHVASCVVVISLTSIAPAILRQASYGTMKIGLYHFFKKRISVTLQRGTYAAAIMCIIAERTETL